MQKPSIARLVVAKVDPADNNGADECPAVITRVWSQQANGAWCVNLRTLHDGANVGWKTSVVLYESRDDAPSDSHPSFCYAWWPPRV